MKNLHTLFISLLIALTVAVVFKPVFTAGFTNYDDDVLVTENRLIKEASAENLKSIFFSPYVGLYHPLVLLSYSAEYALAGLDPLVFHFTNLLLHVMNTLLVFWLITLVSKSPPAALITALLFGIHPMHVESVAWIAERKDVLYAFFYLFSLITYVYFLRSGKKRLYTAALILFAMSLLSKPMAVTLPLVLILLDYVETAEFKLSSLLNKAPFFVLSVLFGVITLASHYDSRDSLEPVHLSLSGGLSEAANGTIFYVSKLLYPVNLSCFYPYTGDGWKSFIVFEPFLPMLLAAIAVAAVYYFRRKRGVLFGSVFFAVALLPVLQFVPFGQKIPADRFTYIPSIGFFYIIAEGFAALWNRRSTLIKSAAAVAAAAAIAALSLSANARCKVWHDSFSLWNDTINKFPELPQAYKNRADAYKYAGLAEKAIADYDRAVAIKPGYPQALNNRGNLFASLGDYKKALADYSAAIKENPNYVSAIFNRAITYALLNRHEEAAADYSLAIEKNPRYREAFNNRGVIRARLGNYGPAIDDFNKAIAIDPYFNEAYANRALAHFSAGDYSGAEKDTKLLIKRKHPVDPGFHKALMDKRPELK